MTTQDVQIEPATMRALLSTRSALSSWLTRTLRIQKKKYVPASRFTYKEELLMLQVRMRYDTET